MGVSMWEICTVLGTFQKYMSSRLDLLRLLENLGIVKESDLYLLYMFLLFSNYEFFNSNKSN